MINHVRTLLLNVDGSVQLGQAYPGEEYVPPDFRTVLLPDALVSVRRVLFGDNPDRVMLNYRLRQLLSLVHAGPLDEHTRSKDARITYWPVRSPDLFIDSFQSVSVSQTAGDRKNFYLLGNPQMLVTNRLLFQWRVLVLDNTQVIVNQLSLPMLTNEYTYTLTDSISSIIPLSPSQLSFRFQEGAGSTWFIEAIARPLYSLAEVIEGLDVIVQGAVREYLFGANPAEPYATFRNMWLNSKQLPERLGGLVLALAYRTDELRG